MKIGATQFTDLHRRKSISSGDEKELSTIEIGALGLFLKSGFPKYYL